MTKHDLVGYILIMGFLSLFIYALFAMNNKCTKLQETYEKCTYLSGYFKGYKDACVDFNKNQVKMKLIEHEDGSKEWTWIKEK